MVVRSCRHPTGTREGCPHAVMIGVDPTWPPTPPPRLMSTASYWTSNASRWPWCRSAVGARRTAICSSMRWHRSVKVSPKAWNSGSTQPNPTPRRSRPPRQHIDLGGLFGHQHRLALRQRQHLPLLTHRGTLLTNPPRPSPPPASAGGVASHRPDGRTPPSSSPSRPRPGKPCWSMRTPLAEPSPTPTSKNPVGTTWGEGRPWLCDSEGPGREPGPCCWPPEAARQVGRLPG